MSIGAILLAGGRASRLGGAVKPLIDVGGKTLLAHALEAVVDCEPLTLVGPVLGDVATGRAVRWVREDPPFGGPAAAIVAALEAQDAASDPEWTVVLACDLPGAVPAVARLRRDLDLLPRGTDGVCVGDASSRPQWLTAIYRTAALRTAAGELADAGAGASVRALVADLAVAVFAAPEAETADIDTWEDVKKAGACMPSAGAAGEDAHE